MKNYLNKNILMVLMATVLSACGGDDDPYYYGDFNGLDLTACLAPMQGTTPGAGQQGQGFGTASPDRVVGNIEGRGTLILDIYTNQGGSIEAIGELNIPSVSNLYFGPTNFQGFGYNNGIPGAPATSRSCVSTNGAVGTLEYDTSKQNINVVLMGPGGVHIELSNAVYPQLPVPYISADRIKGGMIMSIPGYNYGTFVLN